MPVIGGLRVAPCCKVREKRKCLMDDALLMGIKSVSIICEWIVGDGVMSSDVE